MLWLALAMVIAGTFFGAALYVSLVEHPARMSCGSEAAVRVFGPSYRRGAAMQAPLAVLGCLASFAAGWPNFEPHASIAGALLGAMIPYTLLVILPTNKRLLDPTLDPHSAEAMALLDNWGRLHLVRTIAGGAALGFLAVRVALH